MKTIIFVCCIVGVLAELPRFRPARFRFQRIELAPTTTDAPMDTTTDSAPYPASGWKPSGQQFTLPTETEAPADSYGAPESAPYPASGWKPAGEPFTLPNEQPPSTSYGVPDNSYGTPSTDAPTTTDNPQAERLEGPVEVQKSAGTYFILLPNGQLQKVQFVTENDVQNMKYSATLQVRDQRPLFVYRP